CCRAARQRARSARDEAADAREQADHARSEANRQGTQLGKQQGRAKTIADTELPTACRTEDRLQAEQRALAIEHAVAVARVEHEAVQGVVAGLHGADTDLAHWQAAQAALTPLRALLTARASATSAGQDVDRRQRALDEAKTCRAAAVTAEETAQTAEGASRTAVEEANR